MSDFRIEHFAEAQRRVIADRERQQKKVDVVALFKPFGLDLSTPGKRI